MKHLLPVFVLLSLVGCASKQRPKEWLDKHGLFHREELEPGMIVAVKIVGGNDSLNGCRRLVDFELDGGMRHDRDLQIETAKQYGSHVVRTWGANTTIGLPYDCYGVQEKKRAKLKLKKGAIAELRKRAIARGDEELLKQTDQYTEDLPKVFED